MTEPLFLDTDCLSAFLWVGYEHLILHLYAGRIGLPQQVYDELKRVPPFKVKVDSLLKGNKVVLYQLQAGTAEAALYFKLTTKPDAGFKIIGKGEASAISLAKLNDGTLGSNNLSDIRPYIELFRLKYRTSADIMAEALEQHLITELEGNVIWHNMLQRKRKLPADTFSQFLA